MLVFHHQGLKWAAVMGKKNQKPPLSGEELKAQALHKARAVLEESGVVGAALLGPPKIRVWVTAALLAEGYEAAGKRVRVPLERQLESELSVGAWIPLAQLARRLSGGTAAEVKKAARRLTERGLAQLVVRGTVVSVVPASEQTLTPPQLKALVSDMNGAVKWLKKAAASKPVATVLVDDLDERLQPWTRLGAASESRGASHETRASGGNEDDEMRLALRGVVLALSEWRRAPGFSSPAGPAAVVAVRLYR